jgi:hypothetical protein
MTPTPPETETRPMTTETTAKVEQSGGSVYAIHTEDGPAIFPTLELLRECYRATGGRITPQDGDKGYYEEREWLPVSPMDAALES